MLRFLLRRLLIIPVALLVVNFVGYAYGHFALPSRSERTPFVQPVEPSPILPAYQAYLTSLLTENLNIPITVPGETRSGPITVGDLMERSVGASLGLLAITLSISAVIGVLIGLLGVKYDPPGISRWLTFGSTVGLAMPSFYIGSLFIFFLVAYILWQGPGTEIPVPLSGFGWDLHLVLPALALVARPTVQIAQLTAGLVSGELNKQYVVAARSFGHTWREIITRDALRNAIAPVILTFSGMLRLLVGELILVEWLFRWPGIGRLLGWSLIPPEFSSSGGSYMFLNPVIIATVLTVIALMFLVADLITALVSQAFDPRLRLAELGGKHG